MSIAEYFCNHVWRTMDTAIFLDSIENSILYFVFVFLTNKNIVYLLVKFGKWME